MTKYAEIEVNFTNEIEVSCRTCRYQIPVLYHNSSNNRFPKCRKGIQSTCALNGYTEWQYGGRGTVKRIYEK